MAKLVENPATPTALAENLRSLAVAYQETTLLHLADAADRELDEVYARLDAADAKVAQACE